jgi:hypothetical protein
MRLKGARKDEIRSAHDLALIIIDECSRVFFNRDMPADRQPQVMDIIGTAIGNMVRDFEIMRRARFANYSLVD